MTIVNTHQYHNNYTLTNTENAFRLHKLNYLGSRWCWFIGFIELNNGWDYVNLCQQESTALVTQPSENGWILRRKK